MYHNCAIWHLCSYIPILLHSLPHVRHLVVGSCLALFWPLSKKKSVVSYCGIWTRILQYNSLMLYPLSYKRMHESSEPCHSFPHAANAFRWLAHVSCRIATTCLLKEHASFFYPFCMAARASRWYVNGTWHYLWDGPSLPGTLPLGSVQDVMPAYNKLGGMSSCNRYRHHTRHYAVVIAIVPSLSRHYFCHNLAVVTHNCLPYTRVPWLQCCRSRWWHPLSRPTPLCTTTMAIQILLSVSLCVSGFRIKLEHLGKYYGRSQYH